MVLIINRFRSPQIFRALLRALRFAMPIPLSHLAALKNEKSNILFRKAPPHEKI